MSWSPGQTLSHYRILGELGAGGMGEVYRAHDANLDRDVAIKVLPDAVAADPERVARLEREAKAVAALDHPGIVTVYSFESAGDARFITMQLVEGRPLDELIPPAGLPLSQFLDLATQLATAVAAAHEGGIAHRDLKPGNVMVTETGRIKVLDFGLSKPLAADVALQTEQRTELTAAGHVYGTLAYMSPEQAAGRPADERSDVFSLGVILYELLTGNRPFAAGDQLALMNAIANEAPAPPRALRSDVTPELQRIILRCLEKDREARYASAVELAAALQEELARHVSSHGAEPAAARPLLRPALLSLATAAVVAVAVGAWFWVRGADARRVRNDLVPAIEGLLEDNRTVAAYVSLREAERLLPDDPVLARLLERATLPVSILTRPDGADVYLKRYDGGDEPWVFVGRTPLERTLVPEAYLRWQVRKDDFETTEVAASASMMTDFVVDLVAAGAAPPGMVRIPEGPHYPRGGEEPVTVPGFWMDRFEVTNREFQEFVDAGGYESHEHWQDALAATAPGVGWDELVAGFRDATGRPGPAGWELGHYPEGRGDYPVGGVSWHEAAAYCAFAGKQLPTLYHWYRAAGRSPYSEIVNASNFAGEGPRPVGSYDGIARYGNRDMAGNVKEWVWNEGSGGRFILGGAWSDPTHLFFDPETRPPADRAPSYGFRCARYDEPLDDALSAPSGLVVYDFANVQPVSDEVFEAYRSLHDYDPAPLAPTIASTDDGEPRWRRETVTYATAYGNERMTAYLYLPRNAEPPYQAVVFFPGVTAMFLASSERPADLYQVDFVARGGRVLVYPVYQATYERRYEGARSGPNASRDLVIQWSKDIQRTVDYLESRDDIDASRIAYMGLSLGSEYAPIYLAIEDRFRTAVLLGGGFDASHMLNEPAEIQPWNYAPRVDIPVLMVNGRQDFIFDYENYQVPMFRLLGSAPGDKRHAVYDGGHIPPWNDTIRESLDWLDRYLGPVEVRR